MPKNQYSTALNQMVTLQGENVAELSRRQPVLLVFLRHFGCTFCREALKDLSDRIKAIEAYGSKLVLVHMSDEETAEKYFAKYKLVGVANVADPQCRFYQVFGLTQGTARQLFGLQSWIRGFQAGIIDGHGVGAKQMGDGFQMPGVFVLQNGQIINRFVHKLAGDRPEYVDLLAKSCEIDR